MLLALLMRRVRRLLLIWWIPTGIATPLGRRPRRTRWSNRGTRRSTWSRPVVSSPLLLGSLWGILSTILACTTLPTARIHLGSLLVGWVGLLVLFKVRMPPWLVGLVWSIVVRLLGWLWGCGIALTRGNGRWRLLARGTRDRRALLASRTWWPSRWGL